MAQLTGKAVVTIQKLTVNNNTRANTCTQSDNNEILHSASHTVNHLADSSGIGIIGKSHRNVIQTLAEELSKRHYAIVSPRQVGSKLDSTIVIVAVWSTDTHGLYLLDSAHLVYNNLKYFYTGINISLGSSVTTGFDSGSSLNLSTSINNAEY